MVIITGGAYQGKTAYAMSLYKEARVTDAYPDEAMLSEECPLIWCHLERYVKTFLEETQDVAALYASIDAILEQKKELVLIGREIGNGVVPMEAETRFYRETYGRLMTDLAKKAERVVRVLCGIGMDIL
ncbi:adenosylcobinamide kinase /adenosylcobinamide-phosphate guanylyltransferase [Lachnospiraceae bacterium XBB1006]|nr:adenosylcobinamide kinase /adenosylcobinamide-phosphate guanylyltransferase [Lachnospiraceae bacterium XBB1006]